MQGHAGIKRLEFPDCGHQTVAGLRMCGCDVHFTEIGALFFCADTRNIVDFEQNLPGAGHGLLALRAELQNELAAAHEKIGVEFRLQRPDHAADGRLCRIQRARSARKIEPLFRQFAQGPKLLQCHISLM